MAKADNFDIEFFDSSGEYSSLSRAKSFVISYQPKGARAPSYVIGVFPRVSDSVFEKEVYYLDQLTSKFLGDDKEPYDDFASAKEYLKQKEQMLDIAQGVIEQIEEDDPEMALDLEMLYREELLRSDLQKEYMEDLLKATFEEEEKEIHSKVLGPALIQNFYYVFSDPYEMKGPNYEKVSDFMKVQFRDSIAAIIDEAAVRGADLFSLKINYSFNIGKTSFTDVIPFPRLDVAGKTGSEIADELIEFAEGTPNMEKKFADYLKKDTRGDALKITGYTLENLYSMNN